MRRIALVCFAATMLMVVRADAGGGGRYISPMSVSPSVGFGQGTPMYSTYGPYAGDCCGGCSTACGPCCPGLIPRIVGGIHRALTGVFCGHRFCDPCGVGCGAVAMAGDCCGCDAGMEGMYDGAYEGTIVPDGSLAPPTPADPFRDDPESGSPQARHYRLWNMPQPAQYRTARPAPTRVTVSSNSKPRTLTVHRAEPLRVQAGTTVPTSAKAARNVIRTTSGDSRELEIPANPLRD